MLTVFNVGRGRTGFITFQEELWSPVTPLEVNNGVFTESKPVRIASSTRKLFGELRRSGASLADISNAARWISNNNQSPAAGAPNSKVLAELDLLSATSARSTDDYRAKPNRSIEFVNVRDLIRESLKRVSCEKTFEDLKPKS